MKLLEEINNHFTNWEKPYIPDEILEFERYSPKLEMSVEDIMKLAKNGKLTKLSDSIWSQLDNTESYDIKFGDNKAAEKLAKKHKKDIASIYDAIKENSTLPAPIVMYVNGRYELVAGNTRLMVAKALGITPKIWLFSIDKKSLLQSVHEMATAELSSVEQSVDQMFRQLGLDVIFTQHFKNRILDNGEHGRKDTDANSAARDTDISANEIFAAFSALKATYGKTLLKAKHNPEEFVGVLKDISTKLNIPFSIDYDKIYKGLHKLYASTIMRKKDFKPNSIYDKVLPVKSKGIAEGKFSKSEYAYHATNVKNIPSILKQGLIPNKADNGGYGSNETSLAGYSKKALSGTYFTKSADDVKYIAHDLSPALIIVCKIQPRTADLDEDDITGSLIPEYDLIKTIKNNSNKSVDELAKTTAQNIIDTKLSHFNLDARLLNNLYPELLSYISILISYTKIKNQGDHNQSKQLEPELRAKQNILTKKLKNLTHNKEQERFKVDGVITFSGANRIVGIYDINNRLGWGDLGDFEDDAYHHVKNPQELLPKTNK